MNEARLEALKNWLNRRPETRPVVLEEITYFLNPSKVSVEAVLDALEEEKSFHGNMRELLRKKLIQMRSL